MKIVHDLTQGSPEWHAFRLEHFGASEAAAMLGLSSKVSRSELLRMKHTKIAKEFSDWVQEKILDHGHEVEDLCRPLIEAQIGEDLYPLTYSDGMLSASCDGITMGEDLAWEHKQWNAALAEAVAAGRFPDEYMPQCQQIIMVTGVLKVKFTVSDGTSENQVSMDVLPDSEWQSRIKAGWDQFEKDLSVYVPEPLTVKPMAAPQMGLPAVAIQVTGFIALVDNLSVFGAALSAYVERINKQPETDQDFADLEATVKTLKAAEDALDAAESGALAQTESIDAMRKTVGLYRDTARKNRLLVEKLVKAEKENRRLSILSAATAEFAAHLKSLNERLGKPYMPPIATDFAGVVKGLKSLDSMKDKVNTELARAKIAANAAADLIQANLVTLRELASDHAFLFADTAQIVLKQNDDLTALVKSRIADHKAAEQARIESEREAIRAEEVARIEREARQAAAEAQQIADEATAQNQTIKAQIQTANDGPLMKLGDINARIAPISITADGLARLGFVHIATDKSAKLYRDCDLHAICDALIKVISNAKYPSVIAA
jgi:predicted phage-related endonuclease